MITERIPLKFSGWRALAWLIVLFPLTMVVMDLVITFDPPVLEQEMSVRDILLLVFFFIPAFAVLGFCFKGFFTLEPNEASVLTLFGKYTGTVREQGFWWVNPLNGKKKISLRARNFDSERLKVNDKNGNPIEISAVVVWRVEDTAQASFEVDDFIEYIQVQSESAIRHLATSYPYDLTEGETASLRSSIEEVSEALGNEIQERVGAAGVSVTEARINHLAYAPEIAQVMLQRQQADAIIAARQKIVDGAVGMVEMALERLKEQHVVDLDEERKAAMVSNLLTVLCSESSTQPIVNTGSLY
ncbi:MAG: SPFH domain-containing protein [Gemmatimonadetes bacterium]|nr:SPFH domain-containing protein [Gemmatimonadota bacterium]